MSEKRNQGKLAIMNQKNNLMKVLIEDTEQNIKKFAVPNNKEYQKLIRSLILEVSIVYFYFNVFYQSQWLKCLIKYFL